MRESLSIKVRINKYLARCGVTSRRKADSLIAEQRVTVNGQTVTEFGIRVDPGKDRVEVDGKAVTLPDAFVYYVLHKPQHVISTVDDPRGRETVVDLIPTDRRIFPVGRLDYDTSGVLLLTDDGDLANQLTHPSKEVPRTYQVWYEGVLPADAAARLKAGVDIGEDLPARGTLQGQQQSDDQGIATLTLRAGRYHEVKRIFGALNCTVTRLHRSRFAGLGCEPLAPGEYRKLSQQEVRSLKAGG